MIKRTSSQASTAISSPHDFQENPRYLWSFLDRPSDSDLSTELANIWAEAEQAVAAQASRATPRRKSLFSWMRRVGA